METTYAAYKYQPDFDLLRLTCPPADYVGKNMPAFRWVYESMQHENNFKSQYHKNPKRFLSKADAEKCRAMALSMFESLAAAEQRFRDLREDIGANVYKTLGTHVAKGDLTAADGVNGRIDDHGHFNHHCRQDCCYEERFEVVIKL